MALGYGEQVGYSNLIEIHARPCPRQGRPLHRLEPPAIGQAPDRLCDRRRHAPRRPSSRAWSRSCARTAAASGWTKRWSGSPTPRVFAFAPEDAWKRLKLPGRNPQLLGRLKALAAWRENEARNKNLPRGRIVKDDTLRELASHPPKTQEDLGRVRGLSAGWRSNDIGARLMAALAPRPGRSSRRDARPRAGGPGLTKDGALVSDLLKLLLKIRSKETGVAPKLIARSDELQRWRPARGAGRTSCAAGGSRSSARTRSIWLKAGSPSPSRTAR